MKIFSTCLALWAAGVCGAAAKEVVRDLNITSNGGGHTFTSQNNYNGWVNPEDLTPMPQCIAQQDQSTWLTAMTTCTNKICTRHFGIICTHHQWLTQLSCLSTGFSSNVIKTYLPYCSRSILAKAQLYLWIRSVTDRTWFVDVGDANGLQELSPASLAEGYAAVSVTYHAPTCLTNSVSAPSMEPFQHIIASCSFTSTTQHTGNSARPWEYSESLHSIISLDFETIGYDLTGHSIRYGDYFDKECFCNAFTIDIKNEPCSGSGQLELTKEWLWINTTCGPASLPDNWTDRLKTTGFAHILIDDWHWPMCVTDMPKRVTELPHQCATDACEVDSGGYCKVKRTIDRACFCHNISYDSCGGSCQIFETRIDYVKWLHDLCGNVQDWHGLPDNWHQLAAPTPLDMIPWRWIIKPSNDSNIASISHLGSIKTMETCVSNERKLRSFVLVNIATFLAIILARRTGIPRTIRRFLWHPHPWHWFCTGISIAALQLLANWFNASLVQKTPGYKDVPVYQLIFLWCSMPRLGWLAIFPIGVSPSEAIDFSSAVSSLFAEMILQFLSLYYMVLTINYGRKHNFYFGGIESAERGLPAKIMYAGALLWLLIIIAAFAQLLRATLRINRLAGPDLPKNQNSKQTSSIAKELMTQWNGYGTWLGEKCANYWIGESMILERRSLISGERERYRTYGTFPIQSQDTWISRKLFVELYVVPAISMPLLWIAQWLFWGGFIFLSSEEFCPPKLGVLTAVWIACSFLGATVGAAL